MGRSTVRVLAATLVALLMATSCGEGTSPPQTATSQTTPRQTAPTRTAPSRTETAPPESEPPRTPEATTAATTTPALAVGETAWVAVSVATLWRTPDAPREVDAPALERPARIAAWLADMTLAERRALNGLADSQALLGDRVRVVGLRPAWAKVVVPSQPTPLDARGYPGWVPRRQLTALPPAAAADRATVRLRLAWLREDRVDGDRVYRISYGTRLPVRSTTATYVRVVTPLGVVRRVARTAVVVHPAGEPALERTGPSLVAGAKTFLGLPYLWAGASGFGLDCSGLTWLVHRVHGVRIPRDASPQSVGGTAVGTLRRGDLMFYATSGTVHHVSMYADDGLMVHSPGTGERVEVIPTSTQPYADEFLRARRYLP